jgi:hypothetical protein
MTDLTQKLKERLEFNKNRLSEYRKAKNKEFAGVPGYWDCIETPDDGAEWENARLSPIHSALVECVKALEYYKQFAHLPEHIQLKERIGGGRADEVLNKLREVLK